MKKILIIFSILVFGLLVSACRAPWNPAPTPTPTATWEPGSIYHQTSPLDVTGPIDAAHQAVNSSEKTDRNTENQANQQ